MKKGFDMRWLYLVLVLAVLIPLLRPIGLPVKVGAWSKAVYDYIETLKSGDIILFASDYSPGTESEVGPIRDVLTKHLIKKGVKAILIAFVPEGAMMSNKIANMYLAAGKTYGTDVVDLGYMAGQETALASFFANIKKSVPKDTRGAASDSIPILKSISTLSDVRLLIEMPTGVPGAPEYIRQISPYKAPIIFGISTGMMGSATVYVQSKQAIGLVPGLQGAAEYEKLTGQLGYATTAMDSQSLAYITFISAIVLGNIFHFMEKRRAQKG